MARRTPNTRDKSPLTVRVRKHLDRLEIEFPEEYLDWCRDHGFTPSFEKDHQELYDEQEAARRERNRTKAQSKIHRNPKKFIEQACAGSIHPDEITRPIWREFCRSIHESRADEESRKSLSELLKTVNKKTEFLVESVTFGPHTYAYVDALIRLNDRRAQWIRPLESWRPDSHNGHRQFSSLLRHLLTRYSVPRFMDSAWLRTDKGSYRLRDWFVHIGSGKNIRTAKCPVPLTKRMAHHFVEAPDHYSIEQGLRWGQIHALGGDRRLTDAVLATNIGEDFEHDEFWISVLRFFTTNPMLDRKHVGPMIDYLQHQKLETREVITGPGRVEVQEPPQPNLSMRGRTAGSLLRQVEAWHYELGRAKAVEGLYFERSGYKEFAMATGKDKKNTWRIRELLSSADLVGEGRAMRHCVASYARSCADGLCSIWTMELHTPLGIQKYQTVEVSDHGMIVQCRGKQNRLPTSGEYDILKLWARSASLTISNFVAIDH